MTILPENTTTHGDPLPLLMRKFLQSPTKTATRLVLEAHPELLSDASTALIDELVAAARKTDAPEFERILVEHRDRLIRARAVGVEAAFSEYARENVEVRDTGTFRELLAESVRATQEFEESAAPNALGDAAVAAWQRVLDHPSFAAAPADLKAATINSAAGMLLRRYWIAGNAADLERAVEYWETLAADTAGAPEHEAYLANLAAALQARFELTGSLSDIGNSVDLLEQIVAERPTDAPDRSIYLSNLASALQSRFEGSGDLADLDQAVVASEAAVSQTPTGAADRPRVLSNLGNGLRLKFAHTHSRADLDRAVHVLEEAIEQTPHDSPELSARLNNLGLGLTERYNLTGMQYDLDRALTVLQQSITATPSTSSERPSRLNSIGLALLARNNSSGESSDLDEAVDHFRLAADSAAIDVPERVDFVGNLAHSLQLRFDRIKDPQDLDAAVEAFRAGCVRGITSNIESTLRIAQSWARWAARRGSLAEAVEAYEFALRALNRGYQSQASTEHIGRWLREAQDIPSESAFYMAKVGRAVDAVTTLEHGQELLQWNTGTEGDLHLKHLHADLNDRYVGATQRITALENRSEDPQGEPSRLRQLRAARVDLEVVIEEIRAVPGFDSFLAPMTFDDIAGANQHAVLAYIVATRYGGVALLIDNGRVGVVWLPDLSQEVVQSETIRFFTSNVSARTSDWETEISRLTRWLWDALMGPVLSEVNSGTSLVTIIPVGILRLLPLHAAWTEDPTTPTGRQYGLDVATITYAPNARMLASAGYVAGSINAVNVLGVHEPRPARGAPLLYSGPEIECAVAAFPDGKKLGGVAATRAAVLSAMPNASVLHFACYSNIDPNHSRASGLILANKELLTLEDFVAVRLTGRLAILSASATAFPSHELPNEAVGLPMGILSAGIAGVIASQWAVADIDSMMLMARFYEEWRLQLNDPALMFQEAQRWIRDTTNRHKAETYSAMLDRGQSSWVPRAAAEALYDAVALEEPDERSFASPVHWAGFVYIGQ